MSKIIRYALYSLAIFTGVGGLVVGGVPLVKYAWEMLHDSQYDYYYDTHYLNEPQIIFLLSLILLTGVRIAIALDRPISSPNPPPGIPSRDQPPAALHAGVNPQADNAEGSTLQPAESPDDKLTRLLHQNKN